MHALNDLATEITTGSQSTIEALEHFLDYFSTNSSTVVRYHARDMILWIHSDAGYNNTFKAEAEQEDTFSWEIIQEFQI